MKKVFFTTLMTFLWALLWPTLARGFPLWLNVMFLPPIILCFALQHMRTIERIFICLLCGYIVDSMSGYYIGINMLIMLVFSFALGVSQVFAGRISRIELSYYVVGLSFFYRIVLLIVESLLIKQKGNLYFPQFIMGPIIDGVVSIGFFYMLVKLLSAAKAMEHSDSMRTSFGMYS